jgi:hypothetical protein
MQNLNGARTADYIIRLQNAIHRLNKCESRYLETVAISESFRSFKKDRIWRGEVAVFEIRGHPQAQRAYAWSHIHDDGQTQHVVVLEIPPVTSPQTAVQAAIAAEIMNGTFR